MADWVADTVVTRAGKPEMAIASCFGSPLLSHVLGLSIAMIVSDFVSTDQYRLDVSVSFVTQVKIGIFNHGTPYRFYIHTMPYSQVKLAWIFLGISLISSAIVFPIFKFSPPKYVTQANGSFA